jgi:hypothetical protein
MAKRNAGFLRIKRNIIGLIVLVAVIALAWAFLYDFDSQLMGDAMKRLTTSFRPDMPVTVSYRESLFQKGYVAIFENTSDQPIEVSISIRDGDSGNEKQDTLAFQPNETKEIGWAEGWEFSIGDIIKLTHPDYQESLFIIEDKKD